MKHVFKALPHVKKIWVTKDGHFHLHPHNGGEEIGRDSIKVEPIKEVVEEKKASKKADKIV
jgi:hypothetical protein